MKHPRSSPPGRSPPGGLIFGFRLRRKNVKRVFRGEPRVRDAQRVDDATASRTRSEVRAAALVATMDAPRRQRALARDRAAVARSAPRPGEVVRTNRREAAPEPRERRHRRVRRVGSEEAEEAASSPAPSSSSRGGSHGTSSWSESARSSPSPPLAASRFHALGTIRGMIASSASRRASGGSARRFSPTRRAAVSAPPAPSWSSRPPSHRPSS